MYFFFLDFCPTCISPPPPTSLLSFPRSSLPSQSAHHTNTQQLFKQQLENQKKRGSGELYIFFKDERWERVLRGSGDGQMRDNHNKLLQKQRNVLKTKEERSSDQDESEAKKAQILDSKLYPTEKREGKKEIYAFNGAHLLPLLPPLWRNNWNSEKKTLFVDVSTSSWFGDSLIKRTRNASK